MHIRASSFKLAHTPFSVLGHYFCASTSQVQCQDCLHRDADTIRDSANHWGILLVILRGSCAHTHDSKADGKESDSLTLCKVSRLGRHDIVLFIATNAGSLRYLHSWFRPVSAQLRRHVPRSPSEHDYIARV